MFVPRCCRRAVAGRPCVVARRGLATFEGDVLGSVDKIKDAPSSGRLSPSGELIVENQSTLRVVTFNRPKVLNALSLTQVRELTRLVRAYERSNLVKALVFKGEGGKAFCAGGDIRSLYDNGKDPATRHLTHEFFAEEYILNQLLKFTDVPIVSILNGITMGGGVGLSVHGEFRVATDKTMFAMPETGIGFFPDVGGSYFLPRCESLGVGMYLGLTGERLKGVDTAYAGVATHYIGDRDIDAVVRRLQDVVDNSDSERKTTANMYAIDEMLGEFTPVFEETQFLLNREEIARIFYQDGDQTFDEVYARLAKAAKKEDQTGGWATRALKSIERASPTAVKVTHKLLLNGKRSKKKAASGARDDERMLDCMKMEYNVAQRFMESHDFFEGVRAVVVDKDLSPSWNPATLDAVSAAEVDTYFATKDRKVLDEFAGPDMLEKYKARWR